ncbi:DNA polymerase III subunit alpha [Candidatus Kinetoplastibacterium blastocrithidii TCC012E]|uniref:DNA polymerase III subunit alpha n=1 Tax=Candidatus Kinetoplastidibacterium blastocrithidiae TCC012E TaxID=1208922 RepID=M1LAY9_9PROT|nr:DNA polymerase III subunit alpha [Candidatus Kinetoplastibacterium blastocrithidii]AFZ83886.1 DNA polymerase III subunit alpha 1 [Candidatus Kinetoplastibacterium blastocrithidii (ex Strigomonas culicis)]AGF49633.1 DNA polymerase III subunit alpha [Candidatus Kinetoplastibacterium blastocrithidii TCC012E]
MSYDFKSFVHLRVHSEFSIVDGIVRIEELINLVKDSDQPAVALTDLSNVFGIIKFYKAARASGIKPIIGCDVWLTNDKNRDRPFRVLLLVCNHEGYLNLCSLLTKSFLCNQYNGRVELRKEWLSGQNGLIVLSGGILGDIAYALEINNQVLALDLAKQWKLMFPNSFYIELQRAGFPGEDNYNHMVLELASKLNLPVVATHPIQFLRPSEFQSHEVRVCIAEGSHLSDPKRVSRFREEQYFLNSEKMFNMFSDIPSAILNTVEIAKRCSLTLRLGIPNLPKFEIDAKYSLDDYLILMAEMGLKRRFDFLGNNKINKKIYHERLREECGTINQMGFAGYFLIVQDFINWGKNNGVPVGPGRGSGAGSLVAYALGITDINPMDYDLLFERFLNPERVSMPDFDIDFCQDNRDRVIDYVKSKYGHDAVSQIATFGTFGAKAVIRDVGRVLGIPYSLCDGLSKLIPFSVSEQWTLDKVLSSDAIFKNRYEKEEEVKTLIDIAKPLEGLARNVGMHAGGVLIAPGKLTDFCPLYCQPGQENSLVSQFDKDDVESSGLVKFDFLGLRNLTVLDWSASYVRQCNKGMDDFSVISLPLDDKETYDLLSSGNTVAVFQLESKGMRELLKRLKPSNFEDIIAVLALYRPGPLESGMVNDFVSRKHGVSSINYFHSDLENVLKSTYGVIVYQEQVMLISQIIGGYSLGSADLLRRAMGKKDPEEMAKHRIIFEKGAVNNGYRSDLAVKLFDLMEKFAGYGFNKSHSAAYALIAYQTAWLKTHHPAEFFSATLSSDMDDTDKIQVIFRDAKKNNIKILPPDINLSSFRFEPVVNFTDENKEIAIRYGLGAIKGAGKSAIDDVVRSRKNNGPFSDIFDFCYRMFKILNRRAIESLIKSGAFDFSNSNRAEVLASLNIALEIAEHRNTNVNQSSLFEDDYEQEIPRLRKSIDNIAEWDLLNKLTEEKTAMGYHFSGHLFEYWRDEIRQIIPTTLSKIRSSKQSQLVCGILVSIKTITTRRGKMVLALIDDDTNQVEIVTHQDFYEKNKNDLREDNLIAAKVIVSDDSYSNSFRIVVEQIYSIDDIRSYMAKAVKISIDSDINLESLQSLLKSICSKKEQDKCRVPVYVAYTNLDGKFSCTVKLGDNWRVIVNNEFLLKLRSFLGGKGSVEILY